MLYKYKNLILFVSIILFMELLDYTIIHAILAKISESFSVNVNAVSMSIISYILGTCLFIPTISFFKNKYKSKNILLLCIFIFMISSFICGVSNNIITFDIGRFFQGASISICFPLTLIKLYENINNQYLLKINSIINIPGLAGMALGPFIGAIFSSFFSWRVSFFINIPICIFLLYYCTIIDEFNDSPVGKKQNFNFISFILLSIGLSFSSIGFEIVSFSNINIYIKFLIFIVGVIFILSYILMYFLKKNIVVSLESFKNKSFSQGMIINLFARISIGGFPFALVLYLQYGLNQSLITSGTVLLIISVTGLVSKIFIEKIVKFIGIEKAKNISILFTSIVLMFFSFLSNKQNISYIYVLAVIYGATISCLYTIMNSIVIADINKDKLTDATKIQTITQQYFLGLGTSFTFIIFSMYTSGIILNPHLNFISKNALIFIRAFQITTFILSMTTLLSYCYYIFPLKLFIIFEKKIPEKDDHTTSLEK